MSFYLQDNKSLKLILFITGWGMDENPTLFMDDAEYDVLTLFDYTTLVNLNFDFGKYEEIILVAWSLGVFAANIFFGESNLKFKKCIAINGSGVPVDDNLGIPKKVFELSLKTWSEVSREKFNSRMFSNCSEFENFTLSSSKRDIVNQSEELEWCYEKAQNASQVISLNWDLAIIGLNDKIFPSGNLANYWEQKNVVLIKESYSHFPFFQWAGWSNFLNNSK